MRKRSSQGENNSLNLPTGVFDQGRVPVHESRPVKPVLVNTQNIQKFGTGKGSSIKRQVNMGINRSNYKADASSAKSSRHRRKTGLYWINYSLHLKMWSFFLLEFLSSLMMNFCPMPFVVLEIQIELRCLTTLLVL